MVKDEGQTQVWNTMLSCADAMVLRCAVELRIPHIIHDHGHGRPLSLSKLASLLPTPPPDPSALLRITRFLSRNRIFSSTLVSGEPHYALTPSLSVLVSSSTPNLIPMLMFQTHPSPLAAWHGIATTVTSGANPYTVFEAAEMNPEFNDVFNGAMACVTKEALVKTAPEHPGVTHVAGDMFEFIPQADAVFMKTVMHCFGDEDCIKVLKKCRSVIPETGKVIIVDVVLYSEDDSMLGDIRAKFDMIVFAYTSTGKERTEEEWEKLLKSAGFPRLNIIKIPAIWSIIEAFPQ